MSSDAFLLPIGPRGLYREMLTQAWLRGARLPNDHEAIRRATGVTRTEWSRCWPKIKRFWHEQDGYLVNETQLEVYAEASERHQSARDKASKAGKASAHARAQARLKNQPKINSGTTQVPTQDGHEREHENHPLSQSKTPTTTTTRANPLISGRRTELESELLAHVKAIAEREDLDPTEVIGSLSEYKGQSVMNPAAMTDDRLMQTLKAARSRARPAGGTNHEHDDDHWRIVRGMIKKSRNYTDEQADAAVAEQRAAELAEGGH